MAVTMRMQAAQLITARAPVDPEDDPHDDVRVIDCMAGRSANGGPLASGRSRPG